MSINLKLKKFKVMKAIYSLNKFEIRFLYLIVLMVGLTSTLKAQMPAAITIDPPNATAYDEITLFFDPGLACFENGSLVGSPSLALHSGVKLITGEIWQYIINFDATGANGQATTLMPTGDGRYSITYTPSEYYGFPEGTIVTDICAVFNNGIDWSQDGRDFIPDTQNCMDFFIPLNYQPDNPEFHYHLNMNKLIMDGNFDPSTDLVYVEIEGLVTAPLTDENLDGIYDATIIEGIEVGMTYLYKFRINADQYEDFTREITAVPAVMNVDVWWNNEPIGAMITFIVDMNYQAELGIFNQETDFMDIAGTMNGWGGSTPMESIGPNLYSITLFSEPGIVEYKFRINANWGTSEFPNYGPNRMTWATLNDVTLSHYYDDYNPNTWPATFNVDMNAEIEAGNFNPVNDYLDIAGTMVSWNNSHCVLFDRDWTGEGIYTINLLIDTTNPYIEFKFRINGNWETSEFPSWGPNRFWTVQDTSGGLTNLFECIYNITDVPYAPYVYNVSIAGDPMVGIEISGVYTYFDPNADGEGQTLYQWLRSDNPSGENAGIIDGAIFQNYTIAPEDFGKYLVFQVTPVAITGDPSIGLPVTVVSEMVGTIGIAENGSWDLKISPNPAYELLNIDSRVKLEKAEIYNLFGQILYAVEHMNSQKASISVSGFKTGTYVIKCFDQKGRYTTNTFTKF